MFDSYASHYKEVAGSYSRALLGPLELMELCLASIHYDTYELCRLRASRYSERPYPVPKRESGFDYPAELCLTERKGRLSIENHVQECETARYMQQRIRAKLSS